ncbi:unnamed protein product [Phytomonas sp. Hart1]|nr:unnamed protein product [Phytomonas sp. Hart1]|eukprot:CCW67556.1 unnamed protein product [Phytomonas sp. isolate Hart1]
MPGPGLLSDGWFREECPLWPGQGQGLKVQEVLHDAPTDYQHLTVFESDRAGPWGTVMTLDGAIQMTDYDEFVYHEMLANISLCGHPNPENILIVGGGDGGVVREVLRHKKDSHKPGKGTVLTVDLVDIDAAVVEQSKRHFPQIACGLEDPCVRVTIGDGAAFVEDSIDDSYDVIIVDTTDPDGPASDLFGVEFYRNIMRILRPNGIVCNQCESIWLNLPLITRIVDFMKNDIGFKMAKYAMIYTPSYPCGSIGTLVCAKSAETNVMKPLRPVEKLGFSEDLRYYSTEVHKAAFALPKFVEFLNVD